jgi:hypothetical protein
VSARALVPVIDLQSDEDADDDDHQFNKQTGPVLILHTFICLAIEHMGGAEPAAIGIRPTVVKVGISAYYRHSERKEWCQFDVGSGFL